MKADGFKYSLVQTEELQQVESPPQKMIWVLNGWCSKCSPTIYQLKNSVIINKITQT